MKFFAALMILAASAIAQASPAVGDTASFSGTVAHQGQTFGVQLVISLTAFDAATQSYTQVTTTTIQGRGSNNETKQVGAADLMSDANVDEILTQCEASGGVSETITVAAGTFPTCRLPQDGSEYNIGKVPFGIVKVTGEASLELQSFAAGQ